MASVTFFSVPVEDVERAKEFYSRVFEWKLRRDDTVKTGEFWTMFTPRLNGAGADGSLIEKKISSIPGISIGIVVDSIGDTLEKIVFEGGKIVKEKLTIPGVGYFAVGSDLEDNVFGIWEYNKQDM